MAEYKTGYKIVAVRKNGLFSYTYVSEERYAVKYFPGDWAFPHENCGPLCVYQYKKHINEFLEFESLHGEEQTVEIYKCDYVQSKDRIIFVPSDYKNEPEETQLEHLPYGTRLADKVRLTELVERIAMYEHYHI
jgi:hypothetical protein